MIPSADDRSPSGSAGHTATRARSGSVGASILSTAGSRALLTAIDLWSLPGRRERTILNLNVDSAWASVSHVCGFLLLHLGSSS